jgi:hypothetical protein
MKAEQPQRPFNDQCNFTGCCARAPLHRAEFQPPMTGLGQSRCTRSSGKLAECPLCLSTQRSETSLRAKGLNRFAIVAAVGSA